MLVLPDDVKGHGVKLYDAGCQPDEPWHSEVSIAGPSAVVEEEDVAFPGEALGNHMRMVQADELTKAATLRGGLGVLGSDFPDDVPGCATDDSDDVGVSLADDEILGVEASVGDRVHSVPFVGTNQGEGVGMEDVTISEDARIDIHPVFGFIDKAELVEMFTGAPLESCGSPIPIHLIDDVVFEGSSTDTGVLHGVMGKDEGLALREKILAGGVIANRVAFSFEIMVLACPAVLPAMITPEDAAVPVILVKVGEVPTADPDVAEFVACDENPPWEHLGWLGEM